MRLTINGEEVNYRLETERTLGEVVRGVQGWLGASGFVVTDLSADTRDLLQAPAAEWSGRPLGDVQTLAVTATATAEIRARLWQALASWLAMLAEELADSERDEGTPRLVLDGETDVLAELLGDLPGTLASMNANPFFPPGADQVRRFASFFDGQTADRVRAWDPEKKTAARALLEEMRSRLATRLADAADPRAASGRCVAALRGLLAGMGEVSVMLQTGKDRQAMQTVIGFTDASQELIDLLPFLPPDVERARLVSELTPVLRELVGAFDAKDAILIGDLFEYEIAPRMQRIIPLIEKGL